MSDLVKRNRVRMYRTIISDADASKLVVCALANKVDTAIPGAETASFRYDCDITVQK